MCMCFVPLVPPADIVFVHAGEITIGGGFVFSLMVPLADILFVHAREITIGGGFVFPTLYALHPWEPLLA